MGRSSKPTLPLSLFFKHKIVGTQFEAIARKLRWLVNIRHRQKFPELWELYLEDHRMQRALRELLKSDSCTVDVGCHIGSFLNEAISLAPAGKHYAFEPSETKARWLRKKFTGASVFQKAVGDDNGLASFRENLLHPGHSSLSPTASYDISYDVPICRLDDALAGHRIDLIKIDVEGEELSVIHGARNILTEVRPAVIFECTNAHPRRAELFQEFTSLGYSIYTFTDFLFKRGPIDFNEFVRCGLYPFRAFNFLALPETPSA